jgi:hypothetical protein
VSCATWGSTEACMEGTWPIARFAETTPITRVPAISDVNLVMPIWSASDQDETCHWDACREAGNCETVPEHPTGLGVGYGFSGVGVGGHAGVRRCGPVSQSSIRNWLSQANGEPGVAIDGNKNSDWGSGSCSRTDLTPAWWQVDLGEQSMVTEVSIQGRSECCQYRLDTANGGTIVYVSDTPDFGHGRPCSPLTDGAENGARYGVTCPRDMGGTIGRYVTIYQHIMDEPDFVGYIDARDLSICNVEVTGFVYTEGHIDNAQMGTCCTGPCAPGTWNDAGWCEACEAGTFSATADATECTVCGAGSFAGEGASACRACAVGQVDHDGSAATACVPCVAGRFSDGGGTATVCSGLCAPGSHAAEGAGVCAPCAAGRHDHDADGATPCHLCAAGTFSSEPEALSCETCASGRGAIGGSSSCTAPETPYVQEKCPAEWVACTELHDCMDALAAALARTGGTGSLGRPRAHGRAGLASLRLVEVGPRRGDGARGRLGRARARVRACVCLNTRACFANIKRVLLCPATRSYNARLGITLYPSLPAAPYCAGPAGCAY